MQSTVTNYTWQSRVPLVVFCFALAMCTLMFTSVTMAQVTNQPGIVPEGVTQGFAVEGNMYANSPDTGLGSGESDWFDHAVAGKLGTGVLNNDGTPRTGLLSSTVLVIANVNDPVAPATDDGWVGGSKIVDPTTWGAISHGANSKAEINHFYAMVTKDPVSNDFWFTAAVDRESNNGTNTPAVMILQHGVQFVIDGSTTLTGPNNGLTDNDILVLLPWSKGGNQPAVQIFKWQTSTFVAVDPTVVSATVFVSSNAATAITLPAGYTVYNGQTSYQANTFAEFAVNITQLLGGGGASCGVFSQVVPLTITSQTLASAQCKDFVTPIPINIPLGPSVSCAVDMNVDCFGACNGQITATPSGGQAPYTFSIDTVNFQSSATFSGLCAGTYRITVKDVNNCKATSGPCVITQPPALVVNCTTDKNVSCNGGSDGQITGSASGGTAPYTFSIDGVNFQASGVFSGLAAGTYTITAKDANNCTGTHQCTITEPPAVVANCTTDKNVTCNGGSDGQITGSATGGTAPYTFSKDGVNFQASGVFSGLAAGTYTITAKDANGCTATHQCTVTEPPPLVANCTTNSDASCGASNGQITGSASGGTAPYTFSKDGVNFQASGVFSGLAAGTYTITAKDANGCTATHQCTVASVSGPTANCTTDKNVSCNGGSDGQITGSATGGTAPYTFSKDGVNFQASGVFSGLAAGTYTITAKDVNNCTGTHQCTVTEPTPLVANCTTDKNTNCKSPNGGQITGSASGGTAPYTFSKDGVNFQASGVFAGLSAGTYTITAKDANGCTATHQCTITPDLTPPDLIAAGGTISCLDPTVQLTASSSNACAKYNWTGPNGFTSPQQNPIVSDSGNYTVTVTDTCNGCTHDTTVHVSTTTPTGGGVCGAQGSITDGFELDGNAQSDPLSVNPPDDWDSVYTGGSNATSTTGVDQDLPSRGKDDYFVIGTKDIVDVTQWHYNIQSTPDKDDILDAGAAEYGTLLYFMGDRYSTAGNAQIGFWFFQDTVHPDPNTNLFTGHHIIGDLLVLSNFVQGGGTAVIKAYKWVGSGGSDGALDSLPVSSAHAFAITNPGSTPSPWPFDPKRGPSGSFGKGAFFEGGIDVACLSGVSACFRSFLIETRASASVTAELKDFVFGKFVTNSLSISAQAQASLNRYVGIENGEKTLGAAMPAGYALHANYPNPFNPTTQIKFDLPEQSVVRLSVYNILGQEVAVLVNGIVEAGYREVEWNSKTLAGVGLSSGIYMFRIHATSVSSGKEFNQINKMVLMK